VVEENIAQECVEGYLFVPAPLRFLIFRRGPDRGRIWVPVSGKIERMDANRGAALRRVLLEETGLGAPEGLIDLDWHVPFDGPDGQRWRLHAYGVPLEAEYTPRLSREHETFAWVSAGEALRRLHYPDNRSAVELVLARCFPGASPAPRASD
jgi:8-oxo-dGTP pyrophosphatase MutT (NUDIX family)